MKIAIISDIHDHIGPLRKALGQLGDSDALICCGDLCSPFIIDELGKGFARQTHIVFGNNDADLFRITRKAMAFDQITLHGEYVELEFDGRRFAVNHVDNLGRALATAPEFDVVCFGHNHRFEISEQGGTTLINPGEIMGGLTGCSTVATYDTASGQARRVDLP